MVMLENTCLIGEMKSSKEMLGLVRTLEKLVGIVNKWAHNLDGHTCVHMVNVNQTWYNVHWYKHHSNNMMVQKC